MAVRRIGIGVIGFGWMGQAHSRSMRAITTHFPGCGFRPELVVCSDTVPARRGEAVDAFGFVEATDDWRRVVEHHGVDVVVVTAPNMLHLPIIEATTAAGKDVLCEKPVGGTPEQTARAEELARKAGVVSGVGYNYRFAPLVQYARQLIDDGRLGRITNYRGRFFSMYGADARGPLTWRYRVDEGGYGVSTDILSHAVDLAHFLLGPIERVTATKETFIATRPLAEAGVSHYSRAAADAAMGEVTNEDYFGMLCIFENGARGTFEVSRTLIGPESQNAFEIYGTAGALSWNLETMNELRVYLAGDDALSGYTTVYGGERFPYHGQFVPGSANAIGFEDLIVIEDYEFCCAVQSRRPHHPGFDDALAYVSVQAAALRSCESGAWERVEKVIS